MSDPQAVSTHYTHGSLLDSIRAGVEQLGKTPESLRVEDLAPVEEFHIGGREASEAFLDQLELSPDDHVLDAGCGLGGTSRFAANRYGSRVTGIDLTFEYVETGRVLSAWVGLDQLVTLEQGSVTDLPFNDGVFDKAYMMHVGMNVPDKSRMAAELQRVLRPGGRLGIYDVMGAEQEELLFPVPWASAAALSAVAPVDEYRRVLEQSGLRIVAERDRREFALDFFSRLQARIAEHGLPPLGLHVLMGESAPVKIKNMIENISAGRVAPVELIAEKPA